MTDPNNLIHHDAAVKFECPIGRTFAKQRRLCNGQGCILWRWETIMAGDARHKNAIREAMNETGEKGANHPKAARLVADHPDRYDLVPVRGFCGLGGNP